MIKDIQELNFPSYATMSAATVSLPDMGEWNITSQIKIDGQIAPDFSFDWEVVHDGHKYIMPLRKPQGSKENTSLNSVIDLTFQHWAIWQLKRWPFVTMQPIDSGTAVADEEVATVSLNLGDFCNLFGQVLNYYYGDKITIQLNPDWQYKAEAEVITISHTKVWNVLIEVFHKQFGVRWKIDPNGGYDKYVIKVGYPTTEQSHIFEYGFEGGLMKVERQVQSEEICNLLKGRGGEKNLPYRYFKNVDPENKTFKADPDWIEELANIYFSNLMPATFRSYVQGWKAAHINATDSEGNLLYEGYEPVGEANAYAPWAYRKGFTDTKFHPVEFVADEITINPEAGDRQVEILPGYSPFVKKGSSLDKYGPLMNSLDNNEEIYPTIQGVTVDPYGRIDEVIEVEPITSDDIEEAAENDAQINDIPGSDVKQTATNVAPSSYATIKLPRVYFKVPTGKTGNLLVNVDVLKVTHNNRRINTLKNAEKQGVETVNVYNYDTGQKRSASGIPEGSYYFEVEVDVHNMTTDKTLNITAGTTTVKLNDATLSDKWTNTWRIWVKNIWGTTKLATETAEQYAKRVWEPILGDRVGNEAKVVFASGLLAHEDYEFTIVDIPKYDPKECTWETVDGGKVVKHKYGSEWCIELGKSDAELETLGVYLPSVMRQAIAGDFFFFIGIDMPHQYTKWGEERVDNWKKDNLKEKKDIKPTWVVQTDRVRLNNEGKPDALIRQLHPGDTLRLADKRFIDGAYDTLYLSSLTITYREPTSDDAALNPDVDIVLSDRYEVSANPVSTLQGEVSALAKQVGSISNIEQIVRAVCDKLYLRKDGLPDRSMSPTEFASLITSLGFRSGIVGGSGWGIYKDANGNWVIETDHLNVRQDMNVNNLVINQARARGGMNIETAAFIEVTNVDDTDQGYVCYFDQKDGSVANLFQIDDVAFCNQWTPENEELKFYKRRVIDVGVNSITLTKGYEPVDLPDGTIDTGVNGTGIPVEKDNIIHFGNYTDKTRQYVKVSDVVGGGYERYIYDLDSVNAKGKEYYFAGIQNGMNGDAPRWFVGDIEGKYIEWKNGELVIKGKLTVDSVIGDKTLYEHFSDISNDVTQYEYLKEAFAQSATFEGGLALLSLIKLGTRTEEGGLNVMSGLNGIVLPDSGRKDIAFWAGGDQIDAAFSDDDKSASFVVRMDGTAYACGNTVRFERDKVIVGENIELDNTGLHLIKDGEEFLSVKNASISELSKVIGNPEIEINKQFTIPQYTIYRRTSNSFPIIPITPMTMSSNSAYGINSSLPMVQRGVYTDGFESTVSIGTYSKESTLLINIGIQFGFYISIDEDEINQIAYVENFDFIYTLEIIEGEEVTFFTKEFKKISSKSVSPQQVNASLSLKTSAKKGGEIYLRVKVLKNYEIDNGLSGQQVLGGTLNIGGYARFGISDNTTIGNDGLISVWGNNQLMIDKSSIIMKNSEHGIAIMPSGVKKYVEGEWVPANI